MAGEQPALHRLPPPSRNGVGPGRLPPLRPHRPASGTRPGRHLPPACRQASKQGATRWEWRGGWSGGRPKGTGVYGTARRSWPLSRPRLDLQAVARSKGSASGPGLCGSLRPSQRLHSVRPERWWRGASGGGVCSVRPSEGGACQRSSRPLLRPFRQSGQGAGQFFSSSQGLLLAIKSPLVKLAHTLQQKTHLWIPRKGTVRPQSQFPHSCVCERFIYFQDRSTLHIFPCSRIGRPIVEIHKSLTVTWIWKLWLRPRNSFPGSICFEFSVLCLLQCQQR